MSPDGNWVGFFDEPDLLGKVAVNGGPAATICNISGGGRGASWGSDDTIVFATNDPATGLLRVSAAGGEPDVLTKPDAQKDELDHYFPELLPGGEAVLFTIFPTKGGSENARIAVLDLKTGEQRVLVSGGSQPRYVPTGHIVYGSPEPYGRLPSISTGSRCAAIRCWCSSAWSRNQAGPRASVWQGTVLSSTWRVTLGVGPPRLRSCGLTGRGARRPSMYRLALPAPADLARRDAGGSPGIRSDRSR